MQGGHGRLIRTAVGKQKWSEADAKGGGGGRDILRKLCKCDGQALMEKYQGGNIYYGELLMEISRGGAKGDQ